MLSYISKIIGRKVGLATKNTLINQQMQSTARSQLTTSYTLRALPLCQYHHRSTLTCIALNTKKYALQLLIHLSATSIYQARILLTHNVG